MCYDLYINGKFYASYYSFTAMEIPINNAKEEGKKWEIRGKNFRNK